MKIKRKEITIYVVTKKYDEKEIGKYASAGKDKLWLQKSHYYDVNFRIALLSKDLHRHLE